MLQVWTAVCREFFDGWEVQTIRKLLRTVWCLHTMFSNKKLYKYIKHVFSTTRLRWKDSIECKHTDSPVKKRFLVQQSVKKVMPTVFWKIKRFMTIDFIKKRVIVNSDSSCQLYRQYFTLFIEWPLSIDIFKVDKSLRNEAPCGQGSVDTDCIPYRGLKRPPHPKKRCTEHDTQQYLSARLRRLWSYPSLL